MEFLTVPNLPRLSNSLSDSFLFSKHANSLPDFISSYDWQLSVFEIISLLKIGFYPTAFYISDFLALISCAYCFAGSLIFKILGPGDISFT